MKKLMLLFLMLLFLPYIAHATIVIDAGHGGHDSGTSTYHQLEKDITLSVSKLIKKELSVLGQNVIMTRADDTYLTLKQRADTANDINADVFVSIHVNSSKNKPNTNGAEVWYFHKSLKGRKLADKIAEILDSKRGPKPTKTLYVLKYTKMPAILIELGFLNDTKDLKKLQSRTWQEKIAKDIANTLYISRSA